MPIALSIDRLSFGGRGVGRHNGKAIFVDGVMPGEQVTVALVREKKRYAEGRLLSIDQPSSDRIIPDCPVFDRCGGCQWQFMDYPQQQQQKQQIFTDLLQRQAGVDPSLVHPIVAAPSAWGYRSRAQLKVHWQGEQPLIGFYQGRSHQPVVFDRCPVLHPQLNDLLLTFKQSDGLEPLAGSLCRIDLQIDDEGQRRLVLQLKSPLHPAARIALKGFAEQQGCVVVVQTPAQERLWSSRSDTRLFIHPLAQDRLRLGYGPNGFAQINLAQNRRLVAHLLRIAADRKVSTALDLFCGMGNFTLPLAATGAHCVGIEGSPESVVQAKQNAFDNQLEGVKFLSGRVVDRLKARLDRQNFDMILLDPPREGAADVIPLLAASQTPTLVYISCDPSTLARDLKQLVAGGYQVAAAVPYDLFPQTWHLESLTLLYKG